MWQKPFKLLRALPAATALVLAACPASYTGTAGEMPLAIERIDGETYMLSHEKLVGEGTGEKDRWRLQRIGRSAGDPLFFDAPLVIDWPEAVGAITDFDGEVAAWLAARHPGRLMRIDRLGLDGSRQTWNLEGQTGAPYAYELMVTRPADASFTWLYFNQADDTYRGRYRPLVQIDGDGARLVADDVVWARCDGSCRYLVDNAGELILKNAGGETLESWAGERQYGLRAVCGSDLVTENTRYSVTATAVVARPMPRGFLADLEAGHLECDRNGAEWLWLEWESRNGYSVDATTAAKRPVITLPAGVRPPLAVLSDDGRAVIAFDRFRNGTAEDSTENLACDNDRPLAEPCTVDYVFFSTAVSTAALRR